MYGGFGAVVGCTGQAPIGNGAGHGSNHHEAAIPNATLAPEIGARFGGHKCAGYTVTG